MRRMRFADRHFRAVLLTGILLSGPVAAHAAQTVQPARPGQIASSSSSYSSFASASRAEALDINTASAAELQALPGMGAAYARRIVNGRPYTAKNQLLTRGVLPEAAYVRIRDLIVAHRPPRS